MPRQAKELGAKAVRDLKKPGIYTVGGVPGLKLQVLKTGGKSWLLRVKVGDRRREIGLGGHPAVSLADAREKARKMRESIAQGIDPVVEKKSAEARLRAEQARHLTFDEAAERYIDLKRHEFRNAKHVAQWESTLATYAAPVIGTMSVDDIELADIERVMMDDGFWLEKNETATRVRQRIERVLDWAIAGGHRSGLNPARWKGGLDARLPSPAKLQAKTKQHHPALPIDDMPRFMRDLRSREGITARAIEFCILTVARSGEVRHAGWSEIDLDAKLWTIPASRMKAGREHRVPLCDDAVRLLKDLPREPGSLVFPGSKRQPLSDNTPRMMLRRMHEQDKEKGGKGYIDHNSGRVASLHGFRSTFRDWAGERTSYPHEICEMALAHTIKNKAEAAYRRGDLIEKRRKLMTDWARFCAHSVKETKPSEVTPIRHQHG